jgi:glycerol-3-phosphate dehydrogenase
LACVNVVCLEMGKILFWDEEKMLKEQIECEEYINNYF